MATELLADSAEILHSWCGILCATFRKKKLIGSGHVKELWRHKRNSLQPIFRVKRVFSPVTCRYWLEWRHYAWFGWTHDHIWSLTLHHDHSKVIRGRWPWLTQCLPILANFVVLGVSWGPETEYVANYSHWHFYSASLDYPMSISPIDQVCPQVILAISVIPLPSEMLCVTRIPSINWNNT